MSFGEPVYPDYGEPTSTPKQQLSITQAGDHSALSSQPDQTSPKAGVKSAAASSAVLAAPVAAPAGAITFGPIAIAIGVGVGVGLGIGVTVYWLNNGGWEKIGEVANVISLGIAGTLDEIESMIASVDQAATEWMDEIAEALINMTARGNVGDTGILEEAYELMNSGIAKNICEALDILLAQAKAVDDTAKIQKIKTTKKAKGCQHSRHSGNRKKTQLKLNSND